MAALRCRFCRCVLQSEATQARGYCKFRACVAEAAIAQDEAPPGPKWALARGESSRRERWATGCVRMTRGKWLLEPDESKAHNPARVLRLDPAGASTLYLVQIVDDAEAFR